MIIEIISFGFKTNNLPDANYLIDVRFLKNPFYVDELRDLTGLDEKVIAYFENDQITQDFLPRITQWVEYLIESNSTADKEKIIIAIGCTGGQHRSPYITEVLGRIIRKKFIDKLRVHIHHRELKGDELSRLKAVNS